MVVKKMRKMYSMSILFLISFFVMMMNIEGLSPVLQELFKLSLITQFSFALTLFYLVSICTTAFTIITEERK